MGKGHLCFSFFPAGFLCVTTLPPKCWIKGCPTATWPSFPLSAWHPQAIRDLKFHPRRTGDKGQVCHRGTGILILWHVRVRLTLPFSWGVTRLQLSPPATGPQGLLGIWTLHMPLDPGLSRAQTSGLGLLTEGFKWTQAGGAAAAPAVEGMTCRQQGAASGQTTEPDEQTSKSASSCPAHCPGVLAVSPASQKAILFGFHTQQSREETVGLALLGLGWSLCLPTRRFPASQACHHL